VYNKVYGAVITTYITAIAVVYMENCNKFMHTVYNDSSNGVSI